MIDFIKDWLNEPVTMLETLIIGVIEFEAGCLYTKWRARKEAAK